MSAPTLPTPYPAHVIGLTGGVACGKSTAAAILVQRGWHLIDSDRIGRDLLQPGAAGTKKVVDAFGDIILNNDGSINRARLGNIIFNDPSLRARLNQILHPLIRSSWQSQLVEHVREHPATPVVLDIPLLFEAGLDGHFARIWTVACHNSTQRERMAGRGWSGEHSRARLESQWPVQRKMEASHVVLWNDGSLMLLEAQIQCAAASL